MKNTNAIKNKGFYFNGENGKHEYFFDGQRMTGVTTVLNIIAKPALIAWSARMAAEYVLENLKDLNDLEKICEVAKGVHARKKEGAGDIGKTVHSAIEEWIKNGTEPKLDEFGMKMFNHFKSWASSNDVKFLESEKKIYSSEWFVAGTADFTCEINGKRFIGDIKTGGIYDRVPFFQTAAYRKMLEEIGEKNYDGSIIVNIKKDGSFNEEKDVQFSYDYQSDLEGFTAALKLYRLLNNY